MAYKEYTQTRLNISLVLLDEYGKKLIRFTRFVLVCIVILVLMSAVVGFLDSLGSEEELPLSELVRHGSWMLLDVFQGEASENEPSELLWLCRLNGIVLSSLFAGISVSIFMEPVNTVAFSKYAVIDLERKRVRFRYWVKKPEKNFIYNAQIELLVMTRKETQNGSTETEYLFRYREPENTPKLPIERYSAIRGVHYCDIELAQLSSADASTTLQDVLMNKGEHEDVRYLLRVNGASPTGRIAYRDHSYGVGDFLCGYDFVSIRRDEIEESAMRAAGISDGEADIDWERLCPNLNKRNKNLFHEHFNVVCKQSDTLDNPFKDVTEITENEPTSPYYLESLDCVASGFRREEFAALMKGNLKRWNKRISSRIKSL